MLMKLNAIWNEKLTFTLTHLNISILNLLTSGLQINIPNYVAELKSLFLKGIMWQKVLEYTPSKAGNW